MARRLAHRATARPRKTFEAHCAIWPTADVTGAIEAVLRAAGSREIGTSITIEVAERERMRMWTVVQGWMIGHCDRGWYWTDGPAFEYRRQFHWACETALRNFALAWARSNIEAEIESNVAAWHARRGVVR